jgi:hypothetical protein
MVLGTLTFGLQARGAQVNFPERGYDLEFLRHAPAARVLKSVYNPSSYEGS